VNVNPIKRFNVQLQKAKEHLFKIPAVLLIYSTARELSNIDGANKAARVAYYAILSIFPLLLGLIALFGFLLSSLNIQDELLKFGGDNLPGATDILKQNLANIVSLRGVLGILSMVILFWSGSAGVELQALLLCLNVPKTSDARRVTCIGKTQTAYCIQVARPASILI
jgi:uncharacterized BrkB/YihY/UPF0761 family membrane protein